MQTPNTDLALVMGGGGARAAYQVGVLRAIARRLPELDLPILTGISAGAINTAHLANHTGSFSGAIEELVELWSSLDTSRVFEVRAASLLWRVLRVGSRLSIGVPANTRSPRGMVDTEPLRKTLTDALRPRNGRLEGVRVNLERGRLKAVALTATRYDTGQTLTFFSGRDIQGWERPQRRSVQTDLRVEHIMASAALPLFFPSEAIDGAHYGDGGIRLIAPLAPALHLGAQKILAISTRHGQSGAEADRPNFEGPPSPAQVMGVLFNAIFLDQLDQDALHLERINRLLETSPPDGRGDLRPVELLVLRPSVDLGELANEFEPQLPGMFRYLTRRLGTKQARNQDFLSTVMFQRDYMHRLLELGELDGSTRAEEIAAFVEAPRTRPGGGSRARSASEPTR